MTEEIDFLFEILNEFDDDSSMVFDTIFKTLRPIAIPGSQQIDQNAAPPGQSRIRSHLRIVARGRAAKPVDKHQRRARPRKVVEAQHRILPGELENAHGWSRLIGPSCCPQAVAKVRAGGGKTSGGIGQS